MASEWGGVDFLNSSEEWDGDIVTNPPYKYAKEFVEKALDIIPPGRKVFMFLKIQFLEGQARQKLFETMQLKTVYVCTKRVLCAVNGDFKDGMSSAVCYAWFEWEKGYFGNPQIKWINKQKDNSDKQITLF